jgi:hypothetical protein
MTDMLWDDFPDDDQVGADYVPPADRVPAWAEMAASFARDGWGADEIASALCVDEATVARLLEHAGSST